MPDNTVSIMMPAYNAEKYIGQAIESVLAQTFQDWKLIIVNDGSTDATPDILANYPDSRIKIFHQPNGGEASARNTALSHIDAEFLAFLDADDAFLPDHLSATVGYLLSHPDQSGVYTDGFYVDENNVRLKPLSSRRRGPFEGDIFEQMVRASDVFGAPVCVVLRNDRIAEAQLTFDREIIIGPDWDFLTRFSEDAQVGYINQKTCLYRVHTTNISLRTKQEKRIFSLARCRQKAIKLSRFNDCSLDTRRYVFYDLLINILSDYPGQQAEIIQSQEFQELPTEQRGELLRLMASKAILTGSKPIIISEWFMRSKAVSPRDWRGRVVEVLYNLSPRICSAFLKQRYKNVNNLQTLAPFNDLLKP